MMEQGFRGNCDSQASWGCAPALPNRIRVVSLRVIHAVFHMKHDTNQKASPCRLQATSRRRTKKFFGAAVLQKCCRGVGEQPTFAKQICFWELLFLLQLHLWKLSHSQFDCFYETSCKFKQGNGAIAARRQAKAGVEPPFAGRERPFFLGIWHL